MSLVLRLCTSRKGGTGELGGFQRKADITCLLLDLAVESPWLALGGPFLASCLLCTNGLRKQSSGQVEPPFLAVKLLSRSVRMVIARPRAITIESSLTQVGEVLVMNLHRMAAMTLESRFLCRLGIHRYMVGICSIQDG